jgi:hypothetical protein
MECILIKNQSILEPPDLLGHGLQFEKTVFWTHPLCFASFRTTRVVVKTVATRGFDSDDLQNTHHMRSGIISFHTLKLTVQMEALDMKLAP